LTVTPPTECGSPASTIAARAMFMPCSPSGKRAADDGVLDRLRVEGGHLRQRVAHRGHQQVVGARVAEVAPAALPIGVRVAATM
jgi:hypothetical protein